MSHRPQAALAFCLVLLAVGGLPQTAQAQVVDVPAWGVYGGVPRFRAPEAIGGGGRITPTGWGAEVGVLHTRPLKQHLSFVGSLGLLTFRPDYGTVSSSARVSGALLTVGLEAPFTTGSWAPVLGVMGGPAFDFGEGQSRLILTWHAYAGVRGRLDERWRLRAAVHGQIYNQWTTRLLGLRLGVERTVR